MMKQWDFACIVRDKEKLTDIEQQAERDLYINNAFRSIEDVVTQISYNEVDFCAFCYELRRQDLEDKYTHEFIYGQVKPHALVEIAKSNFWDSSTGQMKVQEKDVYLVQNMENQTVVGHPKSSDANFTIEHPSADQVFEMKLLLTPNGFNI